MINFIKQKNDMKKLAYIVITSSMFLTTCNKLQQGFTTIYGMVTTDSTAACNASMYAQMTLHIVQQKPTMNWLITTD